MIKKFNKNIESFLFFIRNSRTVVILLYYNKYLILYLHGFYEKREYLISACKIIKLRRLRKLPQLAAYLIYYV